MCSQRGNIQTQINDTAMFSCHVEQHSKGSDHFRISDDILPGNVTLKLPFMFCIISLYECQY